jgi:hypothetical protein
MVIVKSVARVINELVGKVSLLQKTDITLLISLAINLRLIYISVAKNVGHPSLSATPCAKPWHCKLRLTCPIGSQLWLPTMAVRATSHDPECTACNLYRYPFFGSAARRSEKAACAVEELQVTLHVSRFFLVDCKWVNWKVEEQLAGKQTTFKAATQRCK